MHAARPTRLIARLAAAATACAVCIAGATWAAAQTQGDAAKEKIRQKVMEKLKEKKGDKPAPSKKPATSAPARSTDGDNTPAVSIKSSEIDAMLDKELAKAGATLSPVTKDADFLRRVYLDLTGKPPTPDKLDAFLKDADPAKRSTVIDALLETDDCAHHWARYWRDVIGYHAINQFARLGSKNFEDWMAEQIKKNVHWDKVATDLITATGAVAEEGRTFLVFAQFENNTMNTPINLAAETTRVFMGIQIQCAQCHDHPYDQWKREQFHDMAAFFARTFVRQEMGMPPTFEVTSIDALAKQRMEEEAKKRGMPALAKVPPEKRAALKKGGRLGPDRMEHRMPDKDDPEKKTVMHPKFLTGQETAHGLPDEERRQLFANFVTSKSDQWFAKAYVNRIWGELMGEGFYEPVDDLGPGREARFPMVINRMASAWKASDYDVKWLFRLVMNTEAYQREIRPRDPSSGAMPFAAVCPQRLSGDQIFDSLVNALGINESALPRGPMPQNPQARRPGAGGPRFQINFEFGVDPSTPIDDIQGTVPQALLLMNSPLISGQIRAQGDTILARLLSVYDNDEEVIRLLYKRVLARVPTEGELKTCKEYVKEVNNRNEAFEDLLWSLVNSTEFITKR